LLTVPKEKDDFIKDRIKTVPRILRMFKMQKYAAHLSARGFNDGLWCFTNQLEIDGLYPPELTDKYNEKKQTLKATSTMYKVIFAASVILGLAVGLAISAGSSYNLLYGALIGSGIGLGVGAIASGTAGLYTYVTFREKYASKGFVKGKEVAQNAIVETKSDLKKIKKEVMVEHGQYNDLVSDTLENASQVKVNMEREKLPEATSKVENTNKVVKQQTDKIAQKQLEKVVEKQKNNKSNEAIPKKAKKEPEHKKETRDYIIPSYTPALGHRLNNAPYVTPYMTSPYMNNNMVCTQLPNIVSSPYVTHQVPFMQTPYANLDIGYQNMFTNGMLSPYCTNYSYFNSYPNCIPDVMGQCHYPSKVITPFYPYSHDLDKPVEHDLDLVRVVGFGNKWRDKIKDQLENSVKHGSNTYAQQHIKC